MCGERGLLAVAGRGLEWGLWVVVLDAKPWGEAEVSPSWDPFHYGWPGWGGLEGCSSGAALPRGGLLKWC